MRTLALIVAVALVGICSSAHSTAEHGGRPLFTGGWTPIMDLNDPHIQELGGWAVAERVKRAHDGLKFTRVVSGEEQVVSGTNYKLIIDASTDGAGKGAPYGAVVYEDELTMTRQLKSFTPAN